ncbi:MAG: Mur ligase family protein [Gemmatimonadaceae bacterium]
MRTPSQPPMRLSELARVIGASLRGDDAEITGIAHDSRDVRPGFLFVAIPGATVDGARFIDHAIAHGAAAVCATHPVAASATIVTRDPRAALAPLAAAFFRNPARELALFGITGSLGKTSTALLVEAALGGGGIRTGVIGSLGIRFRGRVVQTGMTTPEAPAIHGALRSMVSHGVGAAVMEVTSHSLRLDRVAGLRFDLGALTNIVPDEHLEFHPTPEHYVATKRRFFDLLGARAPVIVNMDDAGARAMAAGIGRPIVGVTLADRADARVRARLMGTDVKGSEFLLTIGDELACLDGSVVDRGELLVRVPLLGRQQMLNATLAMTMAVIAGAEPASAAAGIASMPPIRRRMEIIRTRDPMILDDTVGNAESVRAVFDAVRAIAHTSLHVVYAIRGSRDAGVNVRNARALAEETRALRATLTVTASEDASGDRDRVTTREREATLDTLRESGTGFHYEPRLDAAVRRTLARARDGDLVLLLGAQGMNAGAKMARAVIAGRNGARG